MGLEDYIYRRLQETGRGDPPPRTRKETLDEGYARRAEEHRKRGMEQNRKEATSIRADRERYRIIHEVEQNLNINGEFDAINKKLQLGNSFSESDGDWVIDKHRGRSYKEINGDLVVVYNDDEAKSQSSTVMRGFTYEAWGIESKKTQLRSLGSTWSQEPGHSTFRNENVYTAILSSVKWRASLWFDLEGYKSPSEFYERFGHLGHLFGDVKRVHKCHGNDCHRPDIHAQGDIYLERFSIDVNNPGASKQIFRDQLFKIFTS